MVPRSDGVEDAAGRGGGIELPCFEKATTIELRLGFLGLFLPSSGTFVRLAELSLYRLQFHGPCEFGEVVSSERLYLGLGAHAYKSSGSASLWG